MLTHLAPPIGASAQGTVKIQGGPLTEADYRKAAEDGGFKGKIVMASIRERQAAAEVRSAETL